MTLFKCLLQGRNCPVKNLMHYHTKSQNNRLSTLYKVEYSFFAEQILKKFETDFQGGFALKKES